MAREIALRKLCELAGAIVLETNPRGAYTAYVRRDLINKVEQALIAVGYDMPAARAKLNAERRAAKKKSRMERDAQVVAKYSQGRLVKLMTWRPPVPDEVSRYDIGQVVEPDATSRKGKPDQVYVRWNVTGEPRSWVSAYDIDWA